MIISRELEDEMDDYRQKSLNGKFIITFPKNGEDLVGKAYYYKDENEVVEDAIS